MLASIPIPHEGPMNVSVIDMKTNTAIGAPLIAFDSYADESLAALPANNTNFNVTIPTTLGSACTVAGDCVSGSPTWNRQETDSVDSAMVLVWNGSCADL